MTTFRQLLDQFEASAVTRTAKGRAFEHFTKTFFEVDPYWSARFEDVCMWSDWEGRNNRPDPCSKHYLSLGVFTQENPISQTMQNMIDLLDTHNLQTETKTLQGFHGHIRTLINGINIPEGRQQVITRIYQQFFRIA